VFRRVTNAVNAGADAARTRLQLLLKQGERLALATAGLILAAILAALVLLGCLATLTILLVPEVGVAGALAVSTLVAAVIAAAIGGYSYGKLRGPQSTQSAETEQALRLELDVAQTRLQRALHGGDAEPQPQHRSAAPMMPPPPPPGYPLHEEPAQRASASSNFTGKALATIKAHPALAAGAGFALLSLIGPGRALRLASKGAAAAAMLMSLSRNVKRIMDAAGDGGPPSDLGSQMRPTHPPPRAQPPHPPRAESAPGGDRPAAPGSHPPARPPQARSATPSGSFAPPEPTPPTRPTPTRGQRKEERHHPQR
jgi:hypothetical protein